MKRNATLFILNKKFVDVGRTISLNKQQVNMVYFCLATKVGHSQFHVPHNQKIRARTKKIK